MMPLYEEHKDCPGCPLCAADRPAEEWQEFDCPTCHIDFDREPPLAYEGDTIECYTCGTVFTVTEENCRTARMDATGWSDIPLPKKETHEP